MYFHYSTFALAGLRCRHDLQYDQLEMFLLLLQDQRETNVCILETVSQQKVAHHEQGSDCKDCHA